LKEVIFNSATFKSHAKRVHVWTKLLLTIGIIGRKSDVCRDYCPKFEDAQLPTQASGYFADGTPKYLRLGFRKWKHKPRWLKMKQGEVYYIRLYANPQNLMYCPVHWLFEHWRLRFKGGTPTGPIVSGKCEKTWGNDMKKVFEKAGLKYTSHSCRRGAAQWAYRCCDDLEVVKNVGRWVSLENLSYYISEAKKIAEEKMEANNGRDPVLDFWRFDARSQYSTISSYK
jgi:hypothetical protein